MFVTEIRPLNKKKSRILFDDGEDLVLYNGEIRASRIKEQDRAYTRLDMLKVRDQDLCQTGSVLFVRQPCGRYDERESEEQIIAEAQGRVMAKDQKPWGS